MAFDRVWLATDLGAEAIEPWAHALRICATAGTDLRVLHVRKGTEPPWSQLPTPRMLLTKWGFLPDDASVDDFARLGFKVHLQALEAENPAGLLGAMIEVNAPDLLVLGTHRPSGLRRLFDGSVGEELARHAPRATLVLPDGARPFVDLSEGTVRLRRIIVPLGDRAAQKGLDTAIELVEALDERPVEFLFVHVGPYSEIPQLQLVEKPGWSYRTINFREGAIVGRILEAATAEQVDLISMATHGHDSWWDSVWGSRTERVMRDATVPVLTSMLE
ncbi:MAG: universal stress protein [Alphaproteobacteria bacterium]|nr:universal stress protein [Alphaproteobacteria bacterium]